jgi:hypothetical protein
MLDKETKKYIYNYIRLNYNGHNEAEVMYNLHLEIEDIFYEVQRDIIDENIN